MLIHLLIPKETEPHPACALSCTPLLSPLTPSPGDMFIQISACEHPWAEMTKSPKPWRRNLSPGDAGVTSDLTMTQGWRREMIWRQGWVDEEEMDGGGGVSVGGWSSDITLALINWENGAHCTPQATRETERHEDKAFGSEREEKGVKKNSISLLNSLTLNLMD